MSIKKTNLIRLSQKLLIGCAALLIGLQCAQSAPAAPVVVRNGYLSMGLELAGTQFSLGPSKNEINFVHYDGYIENQSNKALIGLVLQAWIIQGNIKAPAGGALAPMGSPKFLNGVLPGKSRFTLKPRSTQVSQTRKDLNCSSDFVYGASAFRALELGMKPGPATLVLELRQQTQGLDRALLRENFPITLVKKAVKQAPNPNDSNVPIYL